MAGSYEREPPYLQTSDVRPQKHVWPDKPDGSYIRYDVRMRATGALLTGSAGTIPLRTAAVLDAIKHAILAGELRPGQSLTWTAATACW